MPFKPRRKKPEFADLKGVLNQTKQSDNALSQTIQILIERLQLLENILNDELNPDSPNSQFATKFGTYWTKESHISALPNSRMVVAGTGIDLDYTVSGEVTVSANGLGTGFYDAPLSDGDLDETDLIFADGECIIVQVPIP